MGQTSWDCQEELFRQEVENADDIRLSYRLLRKCMGDKQKFCADIKPGRSLHAPVLGAALCLARPEQGAALVMLE